MSPESARAELERVNALAPAKQPAAKLAFYERVLSRFAGSTADLTLDEVFALSRTALGMQGVADPRHT